MVRTAAAGFWSLLRKSVRSARRCTERFQAKSAHEAGSVSIRAGRALGARAWLAAFLLLFGSAAPGLGQTDAIKGAATLSAPDGYARLLLTMADDVDVDVTTAGTILVINFKRPVDIDVDGLADAAPDYVSSARRDPDGTAIRLSLSRKVTVNTMSAGEKIFIDLLPDTWAGAPPSLPPEVVQALAERARAAERALRAQRAADAAKKRPPVRVRALVQPTFVRFVFEMPDGVSVSSMLTDQRLDLTFNAVLHFDLADAKVAAPPNVASITQKAGPDDSAVEIALIGDVDVHSFHDDKNFIVDVAFQPQKPTAQAVVDATRAANAAAAKTAAPSATPAPSQPAASQPTPAQAAPPQAAASPALPVTAPASATSAPAKPAEHVSSKQTDQVAPPTSEKFAKEAGIEIKPDAAPQAAATPAPQAAAAAPADGAAPAPAKPNDAPAAAAASTPAPTQAPGPVASAGETPSPPPLAAPKAAPATSAPASQSASQTPSADGMPSVNAFRDSEGLHLTFRFAATTPAALFRRADTVWLVFDSRKPIDVTPIRNNGGAAIAQVRQVPLENGQAIRIRLNRPQMPSLTSDERSGDPNWTLTFSDAMETPTQPLSVVRNISDSGRSSITVPLVTPGRVHRIVDPEAGDTLLVITATTPVRGFIKRQDFVEMSLLESIHGVVVRPNSDDIAVEMSPDKVMLSRPGGLTLSPVDVKAEHAATAVRPIFDVEEWRKDKAGDFIPRQSELIKAEAAVEADQRTPARIDLARFYLANQLYPEAKAVLDNALAGAKSGSEDPIALVVHSVASSLMGRPELAIKDLDSPSVGPKYDSQLWRGLAYARMHNWADAREKFKNAQFAIAALPLDLQRIVIADAMRASLEVKDYSDADKRSTDLDVVGLTPEMKPAISVMRGRLAEAFGHEKDALSDYKIAIDSPDRAAAAEGKLDEIALLQKRNEISQDDALRELETVEASWRGDALDVRALEMMASLYSSVGRYREALGAVYTANKLDPNSELSRQGQDMASALFSDIFLSNKGDKLSPIDALGLFYEYRDLTPIGRRGDEMIRRLADRLVAVDLLDQGSELLQYQVDHRLEGAARAQVAARLAMVYLMNRKPERALAALRTTRIADLSGELRQQRLLLEARAESDVGRHDLALDIISNIPGREAIRLRSDIYWAARRWRESAEQIELYYGDRWKDFKPLSTVEKGDVIRAVVGYSLAEDGIGLARFREKYAPLMSGDADRAVFETASHPTTASSAEFVQIAKMAGRVDTLDGFIRDMKARFPDAATRAASAPDTDKADPSPTGSLPAIIGVKPAQTAAR